MEPIKHAFARFKVESGLAAPLRPFSSRGRRPGPASELPVAERARLRNDGGGLHQETSLLPPNSFSMRFRQSAAASVLMSVRPPTFITRGPLPSFNKL